MSPPAKVLPAHDFFRFIVPRQDDPPAGVGPAVKQQHEREAAA